MNPRYLFVGAAIVLLSCSGTHADNTVNFVRDIAPIIRSSCLRCHTSPQPEGDLSLATSDNLRDGDLVVPGDASESRLMDIVTPAANGRAEMPKEGAALSPEQIDLLHRWIESGANWPDGFVIEADTVTDRTWWSFQRAVESKPPIPPDAPSGWRMNPIDGFIARRLHEADLTPSPSADRRTLIRRVTLDLTGLPPTPAELAAFVNDPADDDQALVCVVDRLLGSPGYGERWAQHWLDVIRWAETVGFETNLERPNAWPYRDWVIRSLNDDKPYDQFLFAQIAGDTVGEDAALGFLVAGPANLPGQVGRDEAAMRQARQDELDEVIRTVSQGLFGLTIGCARCHNHKFDPITQRDYYTLQAIFAGLSYGERRLRGAENDRWTADIPEARSRLLELQTRRDELMSQHHLRPAVRDVHEERFRPITIDAVRMTIAGTNNGSPASLYEFEVFSADDGEAPSENVALSASGAVPTASGFALANQTRHFDNLTDGSVDKRQAFPWVHDKPGAAWIQVKLPRPTTVDRIVWHKGESMPVDYRLETRAASGDWLEIANARNRMLRVDDVRTADQVQLNGVSSDAVRQIVDNTAAIRAVQRELNRLAAGPQVYAARFDDVPDETWLLNRGDPMQQLERVAPLVPAFLRGETDSDPPLGEVERRLALAAHLTKPDHPLTPRVIVNRVWQHHFGTGLVKTPSDFGRMGAKPSHPQLLDWLAIDFVRHGWSLKRLHRQMVLSQTYRQSSRPRVECLQKDVESRLLWRFPPRRLEAEAIRDSILAVSGKLNLTMGGPGFDFFNQRGGLSDYNERETFDAAGWRRMIYAHKVRMQAVDVFGAFDCPDAGQMTPVRTRSTTPLQSLSLFNSPFIQRQAHFFAERLQHEAGDDSRAQLQRAFELAFGRSPDEIEQQQLMPLAAAHGMEQVCRVIFNTSEFVFLR